MLESCLSLPAGREFSFHTTADLAGVYLSNAKSPAAGIIVVFEIKQPCDCIARGFNLFCLLCVLLRNFAIPGKTFASHREHSIVSLNPHDTILKATLSLNAHLLHGSGRN